MNNDLLRNKTTTAIITGGAQGLGFAIAERLAREGARGIVLSGAKRRKKEKRRRLQSNPKARIVFRKG